MAKKREKPPAPLIERTAKGLKPVDAYDLESILDDPVGTQYEIKRCSKRSLKQLRTYWKALRLVISRDDRWATVEHLSEDIKKTLRYVRPSIDLRTGEVSEAVDSIALNEMDDKEFQQYMDKAMKLLAETVGYDPLQFLHEGQAA